MRNRGPASFTPVFFTLSVQLKIFKTRQNGFEKAEDTTQTQG